MSQRTMWTILAVLMLFGVGAAAQEMDEDWQSGDAVAECAQVGEYQYAFKIDGWGDDASTMNGTYVARFDDGHTNWITIVNSDGTWFDWAADPNPIGAVIVKGGPAANIYRYDPQASSDTGLVSPYNASGGPAEVSHATFCWNPESEIEYVWETAFAFGGDADDCFIGNGFDRWGWSNGPIPQPDGVTGTTVLDWPLWAAAGQCDTGKGTLVGRATVTYNSNGHVVVQYHVDEPYLLGETHVYAGETEFPEVKKGKNGWQATVAPGQYTNDGPFTGDIWVIVHAVVGIPIY